MNEPEVIALEENEILEAMDYEAIQEKQYDELTQLLEQKDRKTLRQRLEEMNEFDVAEFLSELEDAQMLAVFRLLSKETAAEVFANLEPPEQERIITAITDQELSGLIEELYVDDAVDIMEELPANLVKRLMRSATPSTRNLINQYLRYPEDSAGSIMTAEFVDLKKYMSVKESIARIRRIGEDKETIYVCFVTNAHRKLEGIVTVKDLLLHDDDMIIEDLMDRNVVFATTTEDQESVSEKFSDYDLMAMPVVDMEGRLVGIVTVDDVIDVMEQEATEDIEKMAGMTPSDKPYSRTRPLEIWRNRIPWLMFLMLSATFTSMILTSFESRLAAVAGPGALHPQADGHRRQLRRPVRHRRDPQSVPGGYRTAGRPAGAVEGMAGGLSLRPDAGGGQLRQNAPGGRAAAGQRQCHRGRGRHGQPFHCIYCHVRKAGGQPSAHRGGEDRPGPGGNGKSPHLHSDRRRLAADLYLHRQDDSGNLR